MHIAAWRCPSHNLPMRMRFSIRLLLLGVAVLAVVSYGLFVRPTHVAQRFVDAVNRQDLDMAGSLLTDPDVWPFNIDSTNVPSSVDRLYAEVLPRERSDIWSFRRRVLLRVIHQDATDGRHVDWTQDFDAVAYLSGVEVEPNPEGF